MLILASDLVRDLPVTRKEPTQSFQNECLATRIGAPAIASRVIITVPHASNALPHWMREVEETEFWGKLRLEHWAFDRAVAPLAETMAGDLGGKLIPGGVSRLAIDLNRDLQDSSVIPASIPGFGPLDFNAAPDPRDLAARQHLHMCFHAQVEAELGQGFSMTAPSFLVDLHTFDRFGPADVRREVDIGFCVPGATEFALALLEVLIACTRARGAHEPVSVPARVLNVRLDEPYSAGHPGAYVTRRHTGPNVYGAVIEVCDDLFSAPENLQAISMLLCTAIRLAAAKIADVAKA